ncbi:MAG TPA: alpha/beta hydrolase, partial [Actinomycetota bacterium]|nr:alpha/beta hydrolase [Actinomycetota bacterium]
ESEGLMTSRGAFAVAERLGTKPAIFPSNHGGFLGGEYGQTGQPDAFAAKLHEVLAAEA